MTPSLSPPLVSLLCFLVSRLVVPCHFIPSSLWLICNTSFPYSEYSDDQKYVAFGMEIFELADKLMFTDPRSPEYAALFQTFDAHLSFMNDRGSVHLQKTLKRIRESR
jgi:hypothetical protein